MKKVWLILLLFCSGCATVPVPSYLPARHPYVKRFYASYDEILTATDRALADLGWKIVRSTAPSVYERSSGSDLDQKQILLFSNIRHAVMNRYAKMNIFLRSRDDISEVEIRYVTVIALPLRRLTLYRNDSAVQKIFKKIGQILQAETAHALSGQTSRH